MMAQAFPRVRQWLAIMLARPLSWREAVVTGLAFMAVGTVYCQIYCFLALQQMNGDVMPVSASIHRASVDIVPALVVFEIGKRLLARGRWWHWLALIALFAVAVALATAWRLQLDVMRTGLSPRRIAVDRIPFMTLAAAGLAYYLNGGLPPRRATADPPEMLPPASAIDWIRAAGNYVEVHFNGRTRLLRMTLQHARQALPANDFVQIHRSIVVNRSRITDVDGRLRTVRLADGATLAVGDTYRTNLRRT